MSQQNPTHLLNEPDLTGMKIGDYTIMHRLGRGGMADVYLAEQASLKRKVAFKVLHQSLAASPSYVERFKNEAQAAAALTHPNIVRIYEVGTLEQFHYISQEYVDGQNLKQYLVQNRTVSAFMAVTTVRQVAAALHKAKEQRVIHRDIKPENIMVSAGEVKVADFGLARINRKKESQELTQVGMTMGTPLYMSPEQAEGSAVDHRSDIYSLGVTAYHMLAGSPPFEKETAVATAIAHKTEKPKPLSQVRSDLPPELIAIVDKMMAKNPDDRYQDCGGIIKDLLTVVLDQSQEEWSSTFQALSAAEANALYTSHLAATQKLDAVIHGKDRRKRNLKIMATALGLALAGFVVGSSFASLNPPSPLIPAADGKTNPIPRKSNVDDQLKYAKQIPTTEYSKKLKALQAVKEYFPKVGGQLYAKTSKHFWADFEIGLLHYQQKYFDLAEETFQMLSRLDPVEFLTFRLHGQAGMVLVLDKRKAFEGSDVEGINKRIELFRVDILHEIERFEPGLRQRLEEIYGNDSIAEERGL
jgi:serine/threonine protein kinase